MFSASSFSLPLAVGLYLLLTNLITVFLFWQDKRAAIAGSWRVPERRLLFWALIGGTPGAFWARGRFRHKTRKEPFVSLLKATVLLQGAAVCFVAVYLLAPESFAAIFSQFPKPGLE